MNHNIVINNKLKQTKNRLKLSIIISAKHIYKSYPSINTASNRFKSLISILRNKELKNHTEVLNDINLEINKGESLAIIGKNGAGKSTLLKILSGVIKATSGSVQVNGSIGALLELGSGFHPDYTGRDNLKMSAKLAGLDSKDLEKDILKMIDFADIGDYIDQPVKTYSSGMVVRLGFSIITVTKPDLLITDEVLAVGDTDFQRKCIAWIDDYINNDGTLLLVSHSTYHVQKLCKHAIWLEDGKIKKQGNSFSVSQEYQSFYEKNESIQTIQKTDDTNYYIKNLKVLNSEGLEINQLGANQDITLNIRLHSPDNRAPGLAINLMKSDIPIYSTVSELHGAQPIKIEDNIFEYNITVSDNKLLPSDYNIIAYAMDPDCLRMEHKVQKAFKIYAQTQEMGVVQLDTKWN